MSDDIKSIVRFTIKAQRAQQWERTKGELRAMVAIVSAEHNHDADSIGWRLWVGPLREHIESLIREIEEANFHL